MFSTAVNSAVVARLSLVAFTAPMALLTACGGDSGDFCEVLTADTQTSGTVFTPYVSWGSGTGEMDQRLELLEDIQQPPAELTEDLDVWKQRLDDIRAGEAAGDTSELVEEGDEVATAREALSDYYTGQCL